MKKISLVLVVLLACSLVLGSCGKKAETPYDYDLNEYVTLGDFPNVTLDKEAIQKAVDKAVEEVASNHKVMTEVTDRAVENGDTVNIDFVGKIDGVEFDGGTAQGEDLVIGSGSYISGFEEGLIGKNIGETVDLQLKFPESYSNADVAGKDVVFTVTINKISVETIPPLSDDMVRGLNSSEYATVAEFISFTQRSEAEAVIWDNYVASCKLIKLPEKETKTYYDNNIETYKLMAINYYGTTLENLVLAFGYTTLDEFFAETLNAAKNTVKEEMIIYSTVRTYNVTVSDEEYQTLGLEIAIDNGYTDLKEYEELAGKDAVMLQIYKNKLIDMALEANGFFGDVDVDEYITEEETEAAIDTDTPVSGGTNESANPESPEATDTTESAESSAADSATSVPDATEAVPEGDAAVTEVTTSTAVTTDSPEA